MTEPAPFGVRLRSIQRRIAEVEERRDNLYAERSAVIVAALRAGYHVEEVAAMIGLDRSRISRIARAAGFKPRRGGRPRTLGQPTR